MMEREKLMKDLSDIGCLYPKVVDFIINDRKRIAESLVDYVEHDKKCLCSQWREERPKKDGGYETLYGYGNQEKWYQRNESPKCSCGLDETLRRAGIGEGKDGE